MLLHTVFVGVVRVEAALSMAEVKGLDSVAGDSEAVGSVAGDSEAVGSVAGEKGDLEEEEEEAVGLVVEEEEAVGLVVEEEAGVVMEVKGAETGDTQDPTLATHLLENMLRF